MSFVKRALAASVAAAALVVASSSPASAVDAPSSSPVVQPTFGGQVVGACNFLFSGPSLDPSSTPFHIEGNAAYVGTRTVASTELACALRKASTNVEIGRLTLHLPGNTSAVAGSIAVSDFGPFLICTMINVHFTSGDESNPAESFVCRPLTRI